MQSVRTRLDRHGRVVIPAAYRKALGIKAGDEVTVRLDDGEIRIVTLADAIQHAQDLVKARTGGRPLVDEFIEERRSEAASE